MKTISNEKLQEIAKKYARQIAQEVCDNNNNGETLYESETLQLVELLKKELLYQNGYEDEEECEHDMQHNGILIDECSKCGYRKQVAIVQQ